MYFRFNVHRVILLICVSISIYDIFKKPNITTNKASIYATVFL